MHARRKATEELAGDPAGDGADDAAPAAAKAARKGRRKKSEAEAADAAAAAALAAAEAALDEAAAEQGPVVSWADDVGEENRRRFPFHRRLQTAAAEGNVGSAELVFSGMQAAGLEPGPRAYHVLLCAHLKAGDTPSALGVAGRATDAGVQLLPESYAVLIFAALDASPPDVAVAKALYGALAGTDTPLQLPWATLTRLLAAKGFAQEAVAAAREGLRAGLAMDGDVAEAYVKALCDSGQSDEALSFLEAMGPRYGVKPEARHVMHVVAADAASGAFDDASSLIDAAGNRGWGRNAATFNALLGGLVNALRQEQEDEEQRATLAYSFSRVTSRMVQVGVRPNKHTFRLEAEGHVALGDARSAMGAIKSLRTAAGTGGCRLLDASALSSLLALLADKDMPVDMLQLLVYMSEDGCRMPPGALVPDEGGRTPLDRWLLNHMEALSARAEQQEAADALMAAPIQYVGDVPLGPGQCVVDEGGRVVPVAKCTMKQLRAEAEARGVADVKEMKKPELVAVVQAARARLPFNVLTAQVKGVEIVTSARKKKATKASTAAPKVKKRSSRLPVREVWSIDTMSGEVDVLPAPPDSDFRTEAEKFLLGASALEEIDLTDDQYTLASNKSIKEIDFDALLEARMLDEGTAAVMNVGDEDVVSGFATLLPGADEDEEEGPDEDEGAAAPGKEGELDEAAWAKMQSYEARSMDPQTLQEGYRQLQFLESQQIDTDEANLVAGMDVAMDIVRAAEIVGGSVTHADLLVLAEGALAEKNTNAAADVARRLSALLQDPVTYSLEFVLQQYEALAEMCLSQRALMQADVVLEAAEVAGLAPSRAVLGRLTAALNGQPRRNERLGRENAALLQRAGVDELDELTSSDLQMQQQQQLPAPGAAAAAAAAQPPEVAVEAMPAGGEEAAGGEDEELPQDLQDVLDVMEGVMDWSAQHDKMAAAMKRAGLSEDDINEVLAHPSALMSDLRWIPAMLMASYDEDDDEGEGRQVGAGADAEGGSDEDGSSSSFAGMSILQLAKAAARGTLTQAQTNELLDAADAAGLPLLYDEDAQQILWPGTPEYEEWAQEAPEEAEADRQAIVAAFEEEFGPELQEAAGFAADMEKAEAEGRLSGLGADNPAVRDWLSLKQTYHETLVEMGLVPDEGEEGEQQQQQQPGDDAQQEGLAAADREEILQQLQQQLSSMVDAQQDELRAAFEQMGLPVPDLSLDGSDGGGSSDGGSGKQQKQLTGS